MLKTLSVHVLIILTVLTKDLEPHKCKNSLPIVLQCLCNAREKWIQDSQGSYQYLLKIYFKDGLDCLLKQFNSGCKKVLPHIGNLIFAASFGEANDFGELDSTIKSSAEKVLAAYNWEVANPKDVRGRTKCYTRYSASVYYANNIFEIENELMDCLSKGNIGSKQMSNYLQSKSDTAQQKMDKGRYRDGLCFLPQKILHDWE